MTDTTTTETAAPAAPAAPLTAASALAGDTAAAPAPAAAAPAATPPAGDPAAPAAAPLTMPGKDATPEQWSAFYNQIGRPETPDGYELPLPEGDDGAFAKQMAPMLHKHGLTADQAKGLAGDWNSMVAGMQAEQVKAEQAAAQAQHVKNTAEAAELKTEWGEKHTENMEFARRAMTQFLPKDKAGDVVAAIESKLGYKGTIAFLHGIGKGLGESDAPGLGQNNSGATQKSAAEVLYGGTAGKA